MDSRTCLKQRFWSMLRWLHHAVPGDFLGALSCKVFYWIQIHWLWRPLKNSELVVMFMKPLPHDFCFVTWCIIMLELAIWDVVFCCWRCFSSHYSVPRYWSLSLGLNQVSVDLPHQLGVFVHRTAIDLMYCLYCVILSKCKGNSRDSRVWESQEISSYKATQSSPSGTNSHTEIPWNPRDHIFPASWWRMRAFPKLLARICMIVRIALHLCRTNIGPV